MSALAFRSGTVLPAALWAGAMLLAASCRPPSAPEPFSRRLVALYTHDSIAGPAPAKPTTPGSPLPLDGWEAGPGVTDLRVVDGKLTGRTTSAMPVIHLAWSGAEAGADTLHAVVVRMRVSAGAAAAMAFSGDEKTFDLKKQVDESKTWPWRTRAAVHPGDEPRTIEFVPPLTQQASELRHIMFQPTDAPGATFAIELFRVVLREDYLESIPSGLSWQGLSEVYHETLVSRAPEIMRFQLVLPSDPWLDFSVGTVENGPVTFRVGAVLGGSSQFGEAMVAQLFERTITRAHRWEPASVDLSAFAGKKVTLTLSLASESAPGIGLWGSPVMRDRSRPMPDGAPQGVILIWADTLRRDHIGAYGSARKTSPHIDRLAAEGTTFDGCVGQATWTKVATPAVMTSLYPATNGVREFYDRLPASVETMAEVYERAGYATLSYSSILFTGQMTNLHQGFEELHESGSLPDQRSSKTAREYVDRLLPWLTAHADVPFFVFLHVSDPHDPFKPYPPYDTLFNDPSMADEHERQAEAVKKLIQDPLLKDFGMPSRAELVKAGLDPAAYTSFNEGWYDGSIRGMDAEIGRLMEGLRTLGLAEKTLVVFTGDHGEEFLDHGRSFHGQSVYGELNNLPLILHRPGSVPAGRRVAETVESIDLMPTLLAMSRLPVPAEAQGADLAPLLTGAGWKPRPAFSEKAETKDGSDSPPPHDTESFSVTEDGWKLIRNDRRASGVPQFELYDALRDPLNRNDVAAAHPEIVARLSRSLTSWKSKAEGARIAVEAGSKVEMKPEDLERLRSLGYIR